MKLHYLFFISVTAFTLATNSLAQSSEDPIRHYEVEIILYKNVKVPKSTEYTLPVSSPKKSRNMFDLASQSSIQAAKRLKYEVVPKKDLQLVDIAKKIANSSRYDLLMHTSWRQPGLKKSKALPIWIKAGRRFGNEFISIDDKIELREASQTSVEETSLPKTSRLYEVEGKITVSLKRYLHVHTDLVLRKPRRSKDPQLKTADTDQLLYENQADARILDNHLLRDHRRMRSKVLHYIDSPELSMLIIINQYYP